MRGIRSAAELIQRADIPALLLGEAQTPLADPTREALMQSLHQYSTNDCVVVDWNSAVVYEPTGDRDIVDVLEFTLTHLLEVRFYDDLLDRRLFEVYEAISQRRGKILKDPFQKIVKEANTRYIELSELMERVDNSLKVVGDFYLATLFRAAARRFRIPDWQQSITRKMELLARVSNLIEGELNVRRSHVLELIVILLILFEVVMALVGALH